MGSIKYLTKEGLRSVWANRLMSFASIGVLMSCLIFMGSAVLISLNINRFLSSVEDQNVIMLYIAQNVSQQDTQNMGSKIKAMDNVSDCTFISKEEGLKEQLDVIGEASVLFDSLKDDNILPDAYKVTLRDLKQYDATKAELQALPGVESLRDNSELAHQLTSFRRILVIVGSWVIGILFLVSLFIISNTIRLTMYSRRLEINIMKAVGATNGFVRYPFVVEAVVLGCLAGLVSFIFIMYIYKIAINSLGKLLNISQVVAFSSVGIWILLGFLAVGIFSGVIGGSISIGKYLKEEGSEISEV